MTYFQILLLAMIQGAAELLPVSSSAHVIVAERLMGLDPAAPEMTFLLVMLHTGTMGAVIYYFWPRWKKLDLQVLKWAVVATGITGVVGLILKKGIEKIVLEKWLGEPEAEIEMLFKKLPWIATALFCVGIYIWFTGNRNPKRENLTLKDGIWIGLTQALCLPFRGFSRSGATISTGLLLGVSRPKAEDFSFILAVLLTPPVLLWEGRRLLKAVGGSTELTHELLGIFLPGALGMVLAFIAGVCALRWLSAWLEQGKWRYFGVYCMGASLVIFFLTFKLNL